MIRKKQSGSSRVNPVIKVAAAEGDTIISAMSGKADPGKRDFWVRKVLKVLGPGLVTGAADDDSSVVPKTAIRRWLTLNPIAILLTFLLWSYLWGVAGTLLAVSLLATFKLFCDRIEPLRRIGSFLGRP